MLVCYQFHIFTFYDSQISIPALPVSHLLLGEDGDEGDSEEEGGAGGGASTTVELEFDLKNYLQR